DRINPSTMNSRLRLAALIALTGLVSIAQPGRSQESSTDREAARAAEAKNRAENEAMRKEWAAWNAPFKPFRIAGNIYYVGVTGISSFLITTPAGHVLIDTGFELTVPRICDSVKQLGFKIEDIKIILNSHA